MAERTPPGAALTVPSKTLRRALLVLGTCAAIGSAMDADPAPVSAHAGHCNAPPAADLRSETLRLRRVGVFAEPTYVTAPPRDRRGLFVVERAGRIRVVVAGRTLRRPFLDLSSEIQILAEDSEQGLFSMAFAPDYEKTGLFYVFFSDGEGHYRVQEFRRSRRSPNRANRRSRRPLLFVKHRYEFKHHYGGQLQFGPDGFLWIALGDGGGEGTASQDLGSVRGKILRINPRRTPRRPYSIPRGNPFVGRDGARPEIYLDGLRNPYRFSFDRLTGDLVIGDVGDHEAEEVNFVRRRRTAPAPRGGLNFGWPRFEGNVRHDAVQVRLRRYRPPVLEHRHPKAHSLTGGYVVRDRALRGLYGRYVYGDFCDGTIRSARLRDHEATGVRRLGLTLPWLSSFGEDTRGRLYATSLFGPVYRLVRKS